MIDRLRSVLSAALAALACGLAGCDNPACVFAGNCGDSDGSAGVGAFPATFPPDGFWVADGAPELEEAYPEGAGAAATTPVVAVFSESLAEDTLADAFELVDVSLGDMAGGPDVALEAPVLTGEGRVLVLLPAEPLTAGASYELRRTATGRVTDLDGSALDLAAASVLARFTVQAAPTSTLRLIATFPSDGAVDASPRGTLVAVFDRPVDTGSLNGASFAVQVDGAPPAFNPLPAPLDVSGAGGAADSDSRVIVWQSTLPSGAAASLPLGGAFHLSLSPVGAALVPEGGGTALAPLGVDFALLTFDAPSAIVLHTASGDAIGIEDLVGATPLSVDLTLSGAADGDQIELFLFGAALDGSQDIALLRSKNVEGALAMDTWSADDVALAPTSPPADAHLGDGFVAFAFRARRGNLGSAVRVLDVDPLAPDIQDALLDTQPPELIGFGTDGAQDLEFVSSVRDFALTGLASEELGFCDVAAPGVGMHAPLTPVAGSRESGAFVARRIAIAGATPGLLDAVQQAAGVPFTALLYDRAGNASELYNGTFFQTGTSGPGAALPGAPGTMIDVEVRRADTLAHVSDASVFVHEGATGAFVDLATTSAAGLAQVQPAAAQSVVTVDAPGFDLLSVHGVPSARLSLLLERSNQQLSLGSGVVSSPNADLAALERFVGDARRLESNEPLIELTSTSTGANGETLSPFSPTPIEPHRAGALAFLGVVPPASLAAFTPAGFLRAYALELPGAALAAGAVENVAIEVPQLLDEAGVPAGELPLAGPSFDYQDALPGSDGQPRATLEAAVHGLEGSVPAGAAVLFDQGGGTFAARSALPGIAGPTGELVLGEVFDTPLFARVESRDGAGNRAGRRPREPQAVGTLTPPGLPSVQSPAQGASTGSKSYVVQVTDVLPDALGQEGVYAVELADSSGRDWRLLRQDVPGLASVDLLVPDIEAQGGNALASGNVTVAVSVYAWPGLAWNAFLFSDLARLHDHFATAVGHTFAQP